MTRQTKELLGGLALGFSIAMAVVGLGYLTGPVVALTTAIMVLILLFWWAA